jgi:hypothetical protein
MADERDRAWGYGNEIVIGETLKKLRTPREELFITVCHPIRHLQRGGLFTVGYSGDIDLWGRQSYLERIILALKEVSMTHYENCN